MRFLLHFIVLKTLYGHEEATCQDICNHVGECITDPHEFGSYCKDTQNPKVCFGLYFTDASRTSICFQPNNGKCPESFPVPCPGDPCQDICDGLEECRMDPHEFGSYCKKGQNPSVCFGLYYKDESRTNYCFQPANKNCPEKYPVLC